MVEYTSPLSIVILLPLTITFLLFGPCAAHFPTVISSPIAAKESCAFQGGLRGHNGRQRARVLVDCGIHDVRPRHVCFHSVLPVKHRAAVLPPNAQVCCRAEQTH
jgi:hypothetical protein